MDDETTDLEEIAVADRRMQSRTVAGGAIDRTVWEIGRDGLANNPIKSTELIETADAGVREQLLELIEPFEVRYTGGDTAVLTWTETKEKERLRVPSNSEACSKKYIARAIDAVLAPKRLPR